MNKQKKGRKLSRERDQRRAFLKILAGNLIMKEKISTTQARAKEVRSLVERMVRRGAKGKDVATVRYLNARLPKAAAKKVYQQLGERYKDRQGGYLRIIKVPSARKDKAKTVIIEFVK